MSSISTFFFKCFSLKIIVCCRPIIVLPPADIQVIYCELTEAEKDFYDALFRRSKVLVSVIALYTVLLF